LLCPNEEVVLGYPWAKIPNGTRRLKFFGGFKPVTFTQDPAPGTLFNASRHVAITAVDVSGQAKTCAWTLEFPRSEEIGWAGADLEIGNHTSKRHFFCNLFYGLKSRGLALKMTAEATEKLAGSEALTVRLRKGKTVYNGTLSLSRGHRRAALRFQSPVPVAFTLPTDRGFEYRSDVTLQIVSKHIKKENYVTFSLVGQGKQIR
jgi:hypothetical protein